MAEKIHIETIGTGPHLAFIHGWGMNGSVWNALIKPLSKHFTVHVLDLPGMGHSPTITPYHLTAVADRVSEMLPDQTNIVGWSLGGQVAMQIALDQPDVVKRLVLVSTTPCFVNVTGLSTRPHWKVGVDVDVFEKFAINVEQDYHKTMLSFLTLQCLGSRSAGTTLRTLRKQFIARPQPNMHTLKGALDILLETDLRNSLAHIQQPALIIHGDKDTLAPLPGANWMSQYLPESYMRVITGASHAPFLSHQAEFMDALMQFLSPETDKS